MLFHIADSIGKITVATEKRPFFIQKIKPLNTNRTEDFEIVVGETAGSRYNLKVLSAKKAYIYISEKQNLPDYGYMTIFKAVLQALLMNKHIILFHGVVDSDGYLLMNGSKTDWFDRLDKKSDVYGRLITVKKINGVYRMYFNFLKEDFSENSTPVGGIRFVGDGGIVKQSDTGSLLLQSTWYYLFFEHFRKGPNGFLPRLQTEHLNSVLNDFQSSLKPIRKA